MENVSQQYSLCLLGGERKKEAKILDTENEQVMTPEGAAELLQCSVYTLKEHARAGDIPCFKLGNRYRFRKSTLLAWIAEQEKLSLCGKKLS